MRPEIERMTSGECLSVLQEHMNDEKAGRDTSVWQTDFIEKVADVLADALKPKEPVVDARWCRSCGEVHETDGGALYECPECGDIFGYDDNDSHRSECCGKFSAKVADHSCPNGCNEPDEYVDIALV